MTRSWLSHLLQKTILGVVAATVLVAGATMALAEVGSTAPDSEQDDACETDETDECAVENDNDNENENENEDPEEPGDVEPSEPESDEESEIEDVDTEVDDDDEQYRNHGDAVSTAAHECEPGPGHGQCVSEVARSDAGKTPGDDESGDEDGPRGKARGHDKQNGRP